MTEIIKRRPIIHSDNGELTAENTIPVDVAIKFEGIVSTADLHWRLFWINQIFPRKFPKLKS